MISQKDVIHWRTNVHIPKHTVLITVIFFEIMKHQNFNPVFYMNRKKKTNKF